MVPGVSNDAHLADRKLFIILQNFSASYLADPGTDLPDEIAQNFAEVYNNVSRLIWPSSMVPMAPENYCRKACLGRVAGTGIMRR